ncbi:MAG TPA: HAMP domain-containing sensor histidine kinase [Alphaproteobacteria bacterium]|nr:HAMP domain-containing sensor histidine kinase [Alphaproteobacteria bacterium]
MSGDFASRLGRYLGGEGTTVPGYSLNTLSLSFDDPDIERRFTAEHLHRALPTIRIFLLAANALYALFGILDHYILPETHGIMWLIRYAGVCPLLLLSLALTYHPSFPRFAQLVLGTSSFVAGLGIIAMTAFAEEPGNRLYYAGLIMVVIYSASLIRLRCVNSTMICLLLFGLYQVSAIWLNPIPPEYLLSNNFFLGMSVAVGVFSSYVQELYIRKEFISTEMLKQEKSRVLDLLTEAQAANKAKSDFLAVMSHELRTPLNAILGFSEIIKVRMFGPIGSEKYSSYVEDIHSTARHLLTIITDVLDFSKAEVGKLSIAEENIDIIDVLDQCFRIVRDKAAQSGLRLSLRDIPRNVVLKADKTLVKQVFINLLSNALKFTPPGGEITASIVQTLDGGWSVRISDTGIGIAEADIPRVMEPFVQVESVMVRKHGGTGLGLPLSKKIMLLHGGNLQIISTLGAGTTVVVDFPVGRVIAIDDKKAGAA